MFLNNDQLNALREKGFIIGKEVLISEHAKFYTNKVVIGDNTRIDDFTIISAPVNIGKHVHISCFVAILGAETLTMADYSSISAHGAIFTSNDTYDGTFMTNPQVPEMYRQVINKPVFIGKHSIIGAKSTILPGSIIPKGCAIYAHSLINGEINPNSIFAGCPARRIKSRKGKIFELEEQWQNQNT
jgi:dTDP-4-amino-4,6-dideoxy-D-glucose acyltransferase